MPAREQNAAHGRLRPPAQPRGTPIAAPASSPFGDIGAPYRTLPRPCSNCCRTAASDRVRTSSYPACKKKPRNCSASACLTMPTPPSWRRLPYAENGITVLDLAQQRRRGLAGEWAQHYFALSEKLSMGWLCRAVTALPRRDRWRNQDLLSRARRRHPNPASARHRKMAHQRWQRRSTRRARKRFGKSRPANQRHAGL